MFLLKRLQCKVVANRCSKSRRSSRLRDATGGILETILSLCILSAEALGTENKMNSVIAGRILSVHLSGWFTSTHVTRYSSLKVIPFEKKVIEQCFLKLSFYVWPAVQVSSLGELTF